MITPPLSLPTPAPPTLRLADVIREHGDAFLATHGDRLSSDQRRALRAVADCRTAALGGHVYRCGDCGYERVAYNSCRNRHCPTCRASVPAAWLEQQAAHLLPVEYHHVVFTLPAQVHTVAKLNPHTVYAALMQAAAQAVQAVVLLPVMAATINAACGSEIAPPHR